MHLTEEYGIIVSFIVVFFGNTDFLFLKERRVL